MNVRLHPHAAARLIERGATEAEVVNAVETGEKFSAKFGRTGFRRNFAYKWTVARPALRHEAGRGNRCGRWRRLARDYYVGEVLLKRTDVVKLTYDPEHNVAYIALKRKPAEVETIHLSDEVNVDIAPDGTVYGFELLNANEQLGADPPGMILIINEALGETSEVKLPRAS